MEAPVYGEVSEKIFRICLPIPHLKAPPKLVPLFKGTSGQFRADKAAAAASGDCKAAFTVFLKNGMIEGEISPLSLRVRCSLREPVVDETFTVPALVAEVIPNKCTYEVQDGVVTLKLYKADRFRPWTLELAENGLNFIISSNPTSDPPKDASSSGIALG
uniref:CS domain n=1 Tax=Schistocephalus solidus TaxID=70667 RepID=A0A0X3NZ44_SCHSO